jgi:hypothetical protein
MFVAMVVVLLGARTTTLGDADDVDSTALVNIGLVARKTLLATALQSTCSFWCRDVRQVLMVSRLQCMNEYMNDGFEQTKTEQLYESA